MKPQKMQVTQRRNKPVTSDLNIDTSEGRKSILEKIPEKGKDILRAGIAFILALIIYTICVAVLPEQMSYLIRHLIGLIIALLFLWGVNLAQKSEPVIGSSIVVFLFLFFTFSIASHYFVSDGDEKTGTGTSANNDSTQISAPLSLYDAIGSYPLGLTYGQESGWIKVGDCHRYNFSQDSIQLIYRNRPSVKVWQIADLPNESEFKVLNLSTKDVSLLIKS